MRNSFKIKKGISIEPIDPTTVTNPEAGDIIIDSTDDNRLKLFNPTAAEFETISGAGSSNNLMSDFEKLTPTVSNVVAVVDTVTFLPIDDNKKSIKATFSGSNGTIRYEVPVTADLEGVQGVVTLWIKTSVENLSVVATKDGVAQNNGLTVNSSNKWRQYEVPVVFGAANYGFEVRASGAVAGDVFIDEAFVKVDSSMFAKVDTAMTDFVDYTPAITGFGTPTNVRAKWRSTGDTVHIVGHFVSGVSTATDITISLPNGYTTKLATGNNYVVGRGVRGAGNSAYTKDFSILATPGASNLRVGHVESSATKDPLVILQGNEVSGGSGQTFSFYAQVPVNELSAERSTIVTQNTELTAATANEFVANVSATGVVSGQNFDWINGNCVITSTSLFTCTFQSGIFQAAPICTASVQTSGSDTNHIDVRGGAGLTTVAVRTYYHSSTTVNAVYPFKLTCTRSTDYNKSATIIGKFENINSSELVKVQYRRNSGQVITANVTNITWSTLEYDNYNAWNGTQFTAPKSSYYTINVGTRSTANTSHRIIPYVNGASTSILRILPTPYIVSNYVFQGIYLNEGDVLSFRSADAMTLEIDDGYHRISITELPDTESIIKNLSNQKTKCQTKYLSANATTTGLIGDLTFNNLDIAKKYSVSAKMLLERTNTTTNDKYVTVRINNLSIPSASTQMDTRTGNLAYHRSTPSFTSFLTGITSSSVTVEVTSILNMVVSSDSWVQLCELPDTYVETDEW